MENAFTDVAAADGALVKVEALPTVGGHGRHSMLPARAVTVPRPRLRVVYGGDLRFYRRGRSRERLDLSGYFCDWS